MAGIDRRDALRLLAATPIAVGLHLSGTTLSAAHRHAAEAAASGLDSYAPRFFTDREWETLRLLVDFIIPADERSGSATDAGVPEFIDFIMTDPVEEDRTLEARQTAMRGGLAWIDAECHRRFGRKFLECADVERRELLDDIAYWQDDEVEEERSKPGDLRVEVPRHGPAFFSSLRDLTASGFWSSRMGVEDLEYLGNTDTEWKGPPAGVLRRLGFDS